MRTFLYLTHEIPWPLDAGHKVRSQQIVDAFSQLGQVYVAGFAELPKGAPSEGVTGALVKRRDLRLRRRPVRLALALMASFVRGEPYSLSKFVDRAFERDLEALIEAVQPDCIVSTLFMLQALPPMSGRRPAIILDSHNIEHRLWEDFLGAAPAFLRPFMRREAALLSAREHAAWAAVDGVIAICEDDAAVIAPHAATPVVVPVVLPDIQGRAPASRAFDVGLIGVWSWAPNEDGLAWFAKEILPRLRERGLSVGVAGKGVSAATARRLRRGGATLLGYVENVADFYGSVKVIAAPYRRGGGVRMKVVEAIGHGAPVVGTALAFRGVDGLGDMPRATSAAEMVEQLEALVRSPNADADAQARRVQVSRRHGGERAELAVAGLVDQLAATTSSGSGPDTPVN